MRLGIGIGLLFAMSTVLADYSEGMKALTGKDYKTAYQQFEPLAKRGHAEAQLALGRLYLSGWGVKKDSKVALSWYRKSAEAGNEWAQLALGEFYHHGGGGVIEDYKTALFWFRLSADQGNEWAQQHLARMYWHGQGVEKDMVLAHMWWNIVVNVHGLFGREELKSVRREMTSAQIEIAHALARECVASNFKKCG